MAQHIWAGVAGNPQAIADAQHVRSRVFVMEKGLLSRSSTALGRESDAYDDLESTIHFIVYVDGAAAATVRLLRPDRAVARAIGEPMGLDLASRYDLGPFDAPGVSIAEVSRMCVVPEHRGSEVLQELYRAMYRESRRVGLTHWVGAANTETDSLEDAMIAYKLLQREGLVSQPWRVSPKAGASAPGASTRPLYTPEQRARARSGDLTGLRLPRTIRTFAYLAARYMGSPIRERHYTVCSLPLVVDLADVVHTEAFRGHGGHARAA
jgi:L-ornithine Nalpha-acyltransferase